MTSDRSVAERKETHQSSTSKLHCLTFPLVRVSFFTNLLKTLSSLHLFVVSPTLTPPQESHREAFDARTADSRFLGARRKHPFQHSQRLASRELRRSLLSAVLLRLLPPPDREFDQRSGYRFTVSDHSQLRPRPRPLREERQRVDSRLSLCYCISHHRRGRTFPKRTLPSNHLSSRKRGHQRPGRRLGCRPPLLSLRPSPPSRLGVSCSVPCDVCCPLRRSVHRLRDAVLPRLHPRRNRLRDVRRVPNPSRRPPSPRRASRRRNRGMRHGCTHQTSPVGTVDCQLVEGEGRTRRGKESGDTQVALQGLRFKSP